MSPDKSNRASMQMPKLRVVLAEIVRRSEAPPLILGSNDDAVLRPMRDWNISRAFLIPAKNGFPTVAHVGR